MARLFLHFWNVSATFRIWSSGKKNPYLKYVSSHFLTLAIELHMVHFGGSASFTFELYCSLPSTPSSGVASRKFFWGGNSFDFRLAFFGGYRFSKHKMTRYSKNLGGTWPPGPHWLRL